MTDDADSTAPAPRGGWFKGMSTPNPAGRGKGTRNRISQQLVDDFTRHWAEHGYAAIEKVYADNPGLYLKIATSLVPKELLLQVSKPLDEMSDAELARVALDAAPKLIAHFAQEQEAHDDEDD